MGKYTHLDKKLCVRAPQTVKTLWRSDKTVALVENRSTIRRTSSQFQNFNCSKRWRQLLSQENESKTKVSGSLRRFSEFVCACFLNTSAQSLLRICFQFHFLSSHYL